MLKNEALLLGPISPPISGPGVKNKILLEWLEKSSGLKILVLNTYDFRRYNFSRILVGLYNFFLIKKVILSVSKNGRFLFVPLCVIFKKKVILLPAGGSFDDEISRLPRCLRYLYLCCLRRVSVILVETAGLHEGLVNLGLTSVKILPNPRVNKKFVAELDVKNNSFKIIYLSKIREGKGPLLLIEAVKLLERELPEINVSLDFYGLIDDEFKARFEESVAENDFCSYNGVCPPDKVQEIISNYHLFVLPTLFPEGIPGAVIEAMFTGIPIVVSNYTAAPEMIQHEIDGLIVPQNDLFALSDAIRRIMVDSEFRKLVSANVLANSKRYDYDVLMADFKNFITD